MKSGDANIDAISTMHSELTIKGKAVILSGGSGGLGAAVAESLAEKGAIPIVGYLRNRERGESLANRLSSQYDINIPAVCGDILDSAVRQRLIEEAQRAGELYGLVSLVGSPARVPIETATEQDFLESMKTNFIGPVLLARDFAAAVGNRDAAIVFISTMQGVGIFPGSTVYAAPKAALIHTARILARQWKMRVNVVAPGVNNAGMAAKSIAAGKYDSFLEKKVIPRFGGPADVARAVLFFLEPDNYLTGQVLTVDGGLSLKM
jgi:NAD(P)-dependent dehydrogenase (short-subunit alcohol dehydrogenase family)